MHKTINGALGQHFSYLSYIGIFSLMGEFVELACATDSQILTGGVLLLFYMGQKVNVFSSLSL